MDPGLAEIAVCIGLQESSPRGKSQGGLSRCGRNCYGHVGTDFRFSRSQPSDTHRGRISASVLIALFGRREVSAIALPR